MTSDIYNNSLFSNGFAFLKSTNTSTFVYPLGLVLERRRRKRWNDRGRVGVQHSPVNQLLGLPPQEALAERQVSLHQEHHGTSHPSLLIGNLTVSND